MKFTKSVNQIAFGNRQLKNFGLGSLLAGAIAVAVGVMAVGASEVNFYAEDDIARSGMQSMYDDLMSEVQK